MRRLRPPLLTPRQYERVTFAALALVWLIILTGAAVRLTGSGLGCPGWPKCGTGYVAPLEFHAWVEFGNRLVTGLVGLPCVAAFLLAYRDRKSTRLNSSHANISYAVFCLKKKKKLVNVVEPLDVHCSMGRFPIGY